MAIEKISGGVDISVSSLIDFGEDIVSPGGISTLFNRNHSVTKNKLNEVIDFINNLPQGGGNGDVEGALAELKTRLEELNVNVGDITNLETQERNSLVQALNEEVSRRKDGCFNIKDFGAKGDGINDDTSAIREAMQFIDSLGLEVGFHFASLYFPTGVYCCHEIDWINQASIVGTEVSNTLIKYNGAGGSGSYLFKATEWNSCSFAGFYNISFDGLNSQTGQICETLYKDTESVCTDWGFKIENCLFINCFGNAVHFENKGIINIHLDRVRFDAIGGFCFSFIGSDDLENRPVSITRTTYDNELAEDFAAAAKKLGYFDGVHWGKGFLYAKDCRGVNFYISSSRVELNRRTIAHNGRRAMFYLENSNADSLPVLHLNQVVGYFQLEDGADVIFDKYGNTTIRTENVNVLGTRKLYYSSNNYYTPTKSTAMLGITYSNMQQHAGIELNTKNIEVRDEKPDSNVYAQYKAGDLVLLKNPAPGGIMGYQVTSPTVGYACPAGQIIMTDAAVTSGSRMVKVKNLSAFESIGEMAAIIIAAAGIGGIDLATYIESVDLQNSTFTIHDVSQRSISAAIVRFQKPAFTEFGYLGNPNYAERVVSLPTAGIAQRGRIVRTEGAKGIGDKVYMCKKLSNEAYSWVEL